MSQLHRSARVALSGIWYAVSKMDIPIEVKHRAAIYILVTGCNVSGATAARVIGTSKQYVSKVLRQIEDRRDDHDFDRAVCELEERMFGEGI